MSCLPFSAVDMETKRVKNRCWKHDFKRFSQSDHLVLSPIWVLWFITAHLPLWIGPRNSCTQPSHWRYVRPTPAVVLPVGPSSSWTDCRIWCFNPLCCQSSHIHFGISISISEETLKGILVVSSVLGTEPIAVLSCRRPLYRVPEHGACITQKARIRHDSAHGRDKGGTVTLYWAKDLGTVKALPHVNQVYG